MLQQTLLLCGLLGGLLQEINHMKFVFTLLIFACSTTIFGIQDTESCTTLETIPNVVTTDIKAGIERHIRELSESNDGFFPITFEDKEMKLKLVRVHMEYFANLGPRRHFACVDLASEDGNVYEHPLSQSQVQFDHECDPHLFSCVARGI